MSLPPPLPAPVKAGASPAKVFWIVFGSLAGAVLLAVAGFFVLGLTGGARDSAAGGESSFSGRPASVRFAPKDIEERCRAAGLQYYAGESSNRLWSRANEQQQERLEAMGIKLYRIKIRKKSDVVYIISVIEAPSDFSSSQAKEILEIIAPPTPVAISGRYLYCFAARPDPKGGSGDDVIWMTPQQLFEAL